MSMFKLGDLSFNREVDLDTLDDFVFDDKDQEILDYMDAILPNKPTVPQKRTVTEQINVQPYEGSIKFLTDYRTSNVNSYKKLCFTVAQRGWVSLKKFETKNWTNQHSYKQQKEFIDKFKAKCIKGTKDKRTFEQDIVTHATLSTVKQLMSNDIFKASLELCRVENMKERPFLSYMDNILLKGHVTKIERSVNVGMRNGNASNFIFKEPKKRNDGIGVNINRTEELNFLSLMNSLGVTYHGSFYGMKNISGYVNELTKLFTDIFSDDTNFKTHDEYKDYQAINFESEQEGTYIHTEKYLLDGQLDNLKEWQAFKFELLVLALLKTNYIDLTSFYVQVEEYPSTGKEIHGSIYDDHGNSEKIFTYYVNEGTFDIEEKLLLYFYRFLSTLMLVYTQDNLKKFEIAKTDEEIEKLTFSYRDPLIRIIHEGVIGDFIEEAKVKRLERTGATQGARSSNETIDEMRIRFENRHATLVNLVKQKEKGKKNPYCLD